VLHKVFAAGGLSFKTLNHLLEVLAGYKGLITLMLGILLLDLPT